MIKNILFFYSLALAVFISVSGFLGSRKPETLIFQVIFLPVVLYFLIKAIKILRKKEGLGGSLGMGAILLSLIVFIFLLGTSLNRIFFVKSDVSPTPISPSTPTPIASPQEAVRKVVIVIEDGSPSVNVREKPTIYSEIIKRVDGGTTYEILEEEVEWFKIKLDEENSGYVSKRYAKLSQDE